MTSKIKTSIEFKSKLKLEILTITTFEVERLEKIKLSEKVIDIKNYSVDDIKNNLRIFADMGKTGDNWYDDNYWELMKIASDYKQPFQVVCGVTSILSPSCNWLTNVNDVKTILLNDALKGEIDNFKVSTYGQNKRKAFNLLNTPNQNFFDIDEIWIKARKTNAFYNNLYNPHTNNTHVTIDRHALLASLGILKASAIPMSVKIYDFISGIYTSVASEYKLLPSQLQARIWVNYKSYVDR